MMSGLGLPLVIPSVFTFGWILIQTADRWGEAVTEGLCALFLLSVLLTVIAPLAFFGSRYATGPVLIRSMSDG